MFAIQPTLCKVGYVKNFISKPRENIWKFEANSNVTCIKIVLFPAIVVLQEEKRGTFHWDSSVYPYFATAIVKGYGIQKITQNC